MKKISVFLPCAMLFLSICFADQQKPLVLEVIKTSIEVNGKKSQAFDIVQENGQQGYSGTKGQDFDVILKNKTDTPIAIHWHGLILPNNQDGVAYITQLPIPPGGSYYYHFPLTQAGTYWMHSHYMLHEQELMSAPLIIQDPKDLYADYKNIVIMLNDFSFKKPEKIFNDLKHNAMENMDMSHMPMDMSMNHDLNDVVYDAFLANRRTLMHPEIVKVTPGEKIRLRIINASSATNYWVHTGKLQGTLIAADGEYVQPLKNNTFQLAIAQRLDILVTIPKKKGTYPILAQVEGTRKQSGILLVTNNASVIMPAILAAKNSPALNDKQEMQLHPIHPIVTKPVSKTLNYSLEGNMQDYVWTINKQAWPHVDPLIIKQGDHVEMIFTNNSTMSHPMHLHGYVFQVTAINGKPLNNGPLRDTILVMPHSSKKIIFDANNPGIWPMHCHVLYHMEAGMMTTTNYQGYPEPEYYKKLIKHSAK